MVTLVSSVDSTNSGVTNTKRHLGTSIVKFKPVCGTPEIGRAAGLAVTRFRDVTPGEQWARELFRRTDHRDIDGARG